MVNKVHTPISGQKRASVIVTAVLIVTPKEWYAPVIKVTTKCLLKRVTLYHAFLFISN